MDEQHTLYMRRALELARQGEGWTSPNPVVGAVIVNNGQIVGEGYHHRAGGPHAEVEALRAAGSAARHATLYVTLEPCNHYGRTPPCTEAIIAAGISEVFYAVNDPNPKVAGQGHQRLAAAGLSVHCGPCTEEARHLNRFFFHFMTTKRPYVIAKFAASLDGKIATHAGHSQWITGEAARVESHRLRHACDAILVGANTAIYDDPQLTTRLPQHAVSHPVRIVLDSKGRVPLNLRLFESTLPGTTLVATTSRATPERLDALRQQGVEALVLPAMDKGWVDITCLLDELGKRELSSLIVEGGGQVLGSFFEAGQIDEVWAFIAPLIIGGVQAPGPIAGQGARILPEACSLNETSISQLGPDFLIRGIVDSDHAPWKTRTDSCTE